MGINYEGFAFPKGSIGVEVRRTRRLTGEAAEKVCREEVWRRYGRHCAVPGCKQKAEHQHHIVFRARSRTLRYAVENRAPLCPAHHRLLHAGKIMIHPRTADGELIVTGERKYLEFKL